MAVRGDYVAVGGTCGPSQTGHKQCERVAIVHRHAVDDVRYIDVDDRLIDVVWIDDVALLVVMSDTRTSTLATVDVGTLKMARVADLGQNVLQFQSITLRINQCLAVIGQTAVVLRKFAQMVFYDIQTKNIRTLNNGQSWLSCFIKGNIVHVLITLTGPISEKDSP